MQRYTRTLVEEETNLSTMIEQALKQNAKEDKESLENNEFDIVDDTDLNMEDLEHTLEDQDFEDFSNFIEEEREDNEV